MLNWGSFTITWFVWPNSFFHWTFRKQTRYEFSYAAVEKKVCHRITHAKESSFKTSQRNVKWTKVLAFSFQIHLCDCEVYLERIKWLRFPMSFKLKKTFLPVDSDRAYSIKWLWKNRHWALLCLPYVSFMLKFPYWILDKAKQIQTNQMEKKRVRATKAKTRFCRI